MNIFYDYNYLNSIEASLNYSAFVSKLIESVKISANDPIFSLSKEQIEEMNKDMIEEGDRLLKKALVEQERNDIRQFLYSSGVFKIKRY